MRPEKILIVEDSESIRELISDALAQVGAFDVLEATDGPSGLQAAVDEKPDVLLLDLAMPGMDGLQVMEELREADRLMPTIVITAHDEPQTIVRAFRLGAKDFLQKPFQVRDLWSSLEKALREERLRREKEQLTEALAHANQSLKRQLDQWVALNFIAQTLISTLEESEVLRRVVGTVNHLLKVEAGLLLLLDEETDELHFAMTLKGNVPHRSNSTIKLGEGIAGWVAQQGKPLLVPDVRQEPRFDPRIDKITGIKSRSVLSVPLKSRKQLLGVLEVINKRSDRAGFTKDDQELLATLASWISVAVENARLNRTLQDAAATAALRQTVVTLAHYINNVLQSLTLEIDELEQVPDPDPEELSRFLQASRQHVRRISEVIRALDSLQEIESVEYAGSTKMIDLEAALHRLADSR